MSVTGCSSGWRGGSSRREGTEKEHRKARRREDYSILLFSILLAFPPSCSIRIRIQLLAELPVEVHDVSTERELRQGLPRGLVRFRHHAVALLVVEEACLLREPH